MKQDFPSKFRRSLDASWKEGIPANIMMVTLDYYLVPYALFLGASPLEIGLLVAIPHLLGSISQLLAVRVIKELGSRLRFLIHGTGIQATFLVLTALLAFYPFPGRIPVLIALATVFRILANLIGTAWGSLISEYLEPEQRGHYLGWRSRIAGIAGVAGLCLAGFLLEHIKTFSLALGFCLLFLSVAACRFICAHFFRQMDDLPFEETRESRFTFLMFVRRFKESNFVKFTLYVASVTFATQLAAPYFSVYMLRHLHLDYLQYMSIHMSAVIASLLAFPIWGRHADHVGNARVLKTTSFLVPIIPFLWLISAYPPYLIAVELFAGFAWGGFTLCAANYIYDAVRPEKRVRCLGYFNLINGIAVFAGASLGGFLAENLPPFNGTSILTLMALSGLARFAAHFLLSGRFQEVRLSVKPASSRELFFSVLGLRPIAGLNREWNLFSWGKTSSGD